MLTSEFVTNIVEHSDSRLPGGKFTVLVTLHTSDYAWVEVIDQGGGAWTDRRGHERGFAIVAAIAGEGNWGIEVDSNCRVAWFRLNWPPA